MNTARGFGLLFLFACAGCGSSTPPKAAPQPATKISKAESSKQKPHGASDTSEPEEADPGPFPELTEKLQHPRNYWGNEIDIQLCYRSNAKAIERLIACDAPEQQAELKQRLKDVSDWNVRALYAAILACQEIKEGQDWLLAEAGNEKSLRTGDIFWLIGALPDFMPEDRATSSPNVTAVVKNPGIESIKFVPVVNTASPLRPDLEWAVPLMLAALKDHSKRQQHLTLDREKPYEYSVQDLALGYGGFHRLLERLDKEEAIPIFCDYIAKVHPHESIPSGMFGRAHQQILHFLVKKDSPLVGKTLVEFAERCRRIEYGWMEVARVLPWLIGHKSEEAIPLIVDGIAEEMDVFSAVVGTKHEPYLRAIRAKLPEWQDGDLSGPALRRRQMARHHAELILIMGEEEDPVASLMAFAEKPENDYERGFAMRLLQGRDDARIIPWADKLIRKDTYWHTPYALIDLVGSLPTPEAEDCLVSWFDYAFNTIVRDVPGPAEMGTKAGYHKDIAEKLRDRTGQDFGVDAKAWKKWFNEQRKAAGEND